MEMARDLTVETLVVGADGFQGAKKTMTLGIDAEKNFSQGAMEGIPVPRGDALFTQEISGPIPFSMARAKESCPPLWRSSISSNLRSL
jgi:hypothetical protein